MDPVIHRHGSSVLDARESRPELRRRRDVGSLPRYDEWRKNGGKKLPNQMY